MLLWNLYELDTGLVKGALVVGVASPVAVGLADDDLPLLDQPLEDEIDVERLAGVLGSASDVLEIAEQGDLSLVVHGVGPFGGGVGEAAERLAAVGELLEDRLGGARRRRRAAPRPARLRGRGLGSARRSVALSSRGSPWRRL